MADYRIVSRPTFPAVVARVKTLQDEDWDVKGGIAVAVTIKHKGANDIAFFQAMTKES